MARALMNRPGRAGMRALAQGADNASALKARTLALWVAQNQLAAAQIAVPWPALGAMLTPGAFSGTAQVIDSFSCPGATG